MKLLWGSVLCFLLLSSALVSSASFADEAISSRKAQKRKTSWTIVSALETGFGSFQDIQIPVGFDSSTRLDGTEAEPESQKQVGHLIGIRLRIVSPRDRWQWVNRFAAHKLANLTMNLNNADSSYAAVEFESGARFSTVTRRWVLEALLGMQNQYFTNISSGHILSGYAPKLRLMWYPSARHSFSTYFAPIVNPKFSYDGGASDARLENTTLRANSYGLLYELNLDNGAALEFGMRVNQSEVVMENLQAYEGAGFSFVPFMPLSKRLQLTTAIGSIGFVTRW